MPSNPYSIAIFVFDDVELLDFTGPYEVFSALNILGIHPVEIKLIASASNPLKTVNGLQFLADHPLDQPYNTDLLIIPGGVGTKAVVVNSSAMNLIKEWQKMTNFTLSVCTGARVLAHCDLLTGLSVTTHHSAIEELKFLLPESTVVKDTKFTVNDSIITAAGVSSGIEVSLYFIKQTFGDKALADVKRYIEWE